MSSDHLTPPLRRWWTLAVLLLIQLTLLFNAMVITLSSPTVTSDLGFPVSRVQWLVTAFALSFGSLMLLGGRLGDIWGRRTSLYVGLGGFAVASALAGSAHDFSLLIVAVVLQGIFSALLAPATLATIFSMFSNQSDRAKAFAAYGIIAGSGTAFALFVGGALLEWTSWRWCFYVVAVLAALSIAGVADFVSDERSEVNRRVDHRGVLLASGGLFFVIGGLAHAVTSLFPLFASLGWSIHTTSRWLNFFTWGPLIIGLGLFVLAALVRERSKNPMFPIHTLKCRPLVGSLVALVIAGVATVPVVLLLANYLEENLSNSPVHVGFDFLPLVLTVVLSATFASARLLSVSGPRPLVPTGMILCTMGMVLFTRLTPFFDYWGHIFPGLILIGLGLGLILAPAFASATAALAKADAGVSAALITTTSWLGSVVGFAVLTTVAARVSLRTFDHSTSDLITAQKYATVHGLSVVFWWTAILFGVGAVSTFFLLASPAPADPAPASTTQISGQG
ncbi:MAG TPA: MFS transporter [Acidimicrobiales bacterium]